MIFRSNLIAPPLEFQFKLRQPAMQMLRHDVPSDPDFWPDCGYMTHDEAAILYHWAQRTPGWWLDIGARLGWTAAHLSAAGRSVLAVEPELYLPEFHKRFRENTAAHPEIALFAGKAEEFLATNPGAMFSGFVIDADHDAPQPLNDTLGCLEVALSDCVIVFHDYMGPSVWEAVDYLISHGFRRALYWTPNMMAVCWRGPYEPIFHRADPLVERHNRERLEGNVAL